MHEPHKGCRIYKTPWCARELEVARDGILRESDTMPAWLIRDETSRWQVSMKKGDVSFMHPFTVPGRRHAFFVSAVHQRPEGFQTSRIMWDQLGEFKTGHSDERGTHPTLAVLHHYYL